MLAEKLDELLDQLGSAEGGRVSVPTETPIELVDNDPLDQPVEEQFRTGAMRLGWDPSTAQVIIEAYPYVDAVDDGDDDGADPDPAEPTEMLLVRIPVGTARAFVHRTRQVVRAGRPTCPRCGRPVDEDGHVCAPPPGG